MLFATTHGSASVLTVCLTNTLFIWNILSLNAVGLCGLHDRGSLAAFKVLMSHVRPFLHLFSLSMKEKTNEEFKPCGSKRKTPFYMSLALEKSEHLILLQEGLASDEKLAV